MKIKKYIAVLLAAASLLGMFSCQKRYQMVAPPTASQQDDDLDDEDFGDKKDAKLFVTPYGDGLMDGSSWENAVDADYFISILSDQTDLAKTEVYLSEGTYYMSGGSVFGPSIRKNILSVSGGYSISSTGEDLSLRDVDKYTTVFSGDINKNTAADEGDCGLLCVYGGHCSFSGITFRGGYMSEQTASAKKSGAGVYVGGDSDTWAEFLSCRFEGCISAATTSGYAGGPAVYIASGQARLRDCEISGCNGNSRGGALRCNSSAAVLFLDRCSIHDNSVTKEWGAGLQISDGVVCINNSTFCSNTPGSASQGGTVNGGGAMLILNSTILSDDGTAAIRCESASNKASFIAGSIAINTQGKPGFLLNGSNKVAVSGGHNIFNSTSGAIQTSASDASFSGSLGSLEGGVYVWDASKVTMSTYATASEIEGYARAFSPEICEGIGEVFAEWCDGFSVDQRGEQRNPEKMLPGAYDPKLSGTKSLSLSFLPKASALSTGSSRSLDSFGFVLTNPLGGYSYTKKIILSGGEYVASDGEMMLWDGKGTTVSVTAYAPYSEVTDGVITVSCPTNQSTEAKLDEADFLLCNESVNPSSDLVEGKIPLNFAHLNTRLIVKVTADGTALAPSEITSLSVSGVKSSGKCNVGVSSPSVEADGAATTMFPFVGEGAYTLITVPQTATGGTFSVKVTYNKRQYSWSSASAVSLEAGKTAEVTVNLLTTKSSSSSAEGKITIR